MGLFRATDGSCMLYMHNRSTADASNNKLYARAQTGTKEEIALSIYYLHGYETRTLVVLQRSN